MSLASWLQVSVTVDDAVMPLRELPSKAAAGRNRALVRDLDRTEPYAA